MGNEHGKAATATPAGIQSMDEALQKRFSKGIQFNSERGGDPWERRKSSIAQ